MVSACEPGRNHGGDRGEARRDRCSAGKAEEGDAAAMRARAVSERSGRARCGRAAPTGGPGCAGRGVGRGRASARCGVPGCQVGRLGRGASCQRDAAAGNARASAERAEWLTGWPALSVGDARGRRGLSGDGFAEPEGKEGRAGVGLLERVLGRHRERERGPGRTGPGFGCCWVLGFAGFSPFLSLFTLSLLFLIQTKFEFKYRFEFKPHPIN